MNDYIATFFSHYDALAFFNFLKGRGITAKLMPVPRKVSSSCGTCVSFASDAEIDCTDHEVDAVYVQTAGTFVKL